MENQNDSQKVPVKNPFVSRKGFEGMNMKYVAGSEQEVLFDENGKGILSEWYKEQELDFNEDGMSAAPDTMAYKYVKDSKGLPLVKNGEKVLADLSRYTAVGYLAVSIYETPYQNLDIRYLDVRNAEGDFRKAVKILMAVLPNIFEEHSHIILSELRKVTPFLSEEYVVLLKEHVRSIYQRCANLKESESKPNQELKNQ